MRTRDLRAACIILFYAVTLIQASTSPGKCEASSYMSQKEPLKPISNITEENQDTFSTQEEIKNSPDPNTEDIAENCNTIVDKTVIGSNSNLSNVNKCVVSENDDVKVSNNVHDDATNTGYYDVSHSVTYNPRDNSYEFHVPIELEKLDDCQSNFSLRTLKEENECIADTSNKSYDFDPSSVEVSKSIDDINLHFDEIDFNDCQGLAHVGNDFDLATNNVHNNEESTEGCINDNKYTNPLVLNNEVDNEQYDTLSKQYIFKIPSEDIISADTELNSNSAVSCGFQDLHDNNTNEAEMRTFDNIEEHDNIYGKSKSFSSTPDINIEIDDKPIEIEKGPSNLNGLTTTNSMTDNVIDKNGIDYTYTEHVCSENDINNSINIEMNENKNETPEREIMHSSAGGQNNTHINYKTLEKSSYDPATNSYEFNIPQKVGVITSADLCSCYDNNLNDRESEKYTVLQENDIDGSIIANEHSFNAPIDNAGFHCKCSSSNSENLSNFYEINVPDTNEIIVTPKSFINAQDQANHFELKNEMSPSRSIWSDSYDNKMNLVENTYSCKTEKQSSNNTPIFLDDTKTDKNKTPITETLLYDSDTMKATDFEISVIPSEVKRFISSYKSDIESKLPQNICAKYDDTFNTDKKSNQLKSENYVCDQIEVENDFNDLEPSKTGEKSNALIFTPITCDSKETIVSNLPNNEQVQNDDALPPEPTSVNDSKLYQYRNKQELPTSYIQDNNFITPTNYEVIIPSAVVQAEEKPNIKTNDLNSNVFDDSFNNCLQNSAFIVTNSLDPTFSSKKADRNSVSQSSSATMYSNIAHNDNSIFRPVKFQKNPKLSNAIDWFTNVPSYSQKLSTEGTAALLPNGKQMSNDFAKIHNLNAKHNINFVDSNTIEPPYYVKDTLGTNINENSNIAQKYGVNNVKLLTVPDSCTYKNLYTIDSINNTSVYPNSIDARGYNSHNALNIPTLSQTVNPILTENRSFSKPLPMTSELKLNSAMLYLTSNLPPAVSATFSITRNPSDKLLKSPISDPITAKIFNVLNSLKLVSKNEPSSSIYSMNKTPVSVNKGMSDISPSLYSFKPSKNIPFLSVPISYQTPPNVNQVPQNEPSTFETIFPTSPITTLTSGSVPLVCPHKTSVITNLDPLFNYRSPSIPSVTNERVILLNSPNVTDSSSTTSVEDFLEPVSMNPNQYIPYAFSIKDVPASTPKPVASYSSNSLEATSYFTPSCIDGPEPFKTSKLTTNTFNSHSSPVPMSILPYSDLTPLINNNKQDFLNKNTLPTIISSGISSNIPPKLGKMIPGFVSPFYFHPNSTIKKTPFSSIIDTSIHKPIYLNTNVCPESAVSFLSNPCNSDISITEARCSGAASPVTSILSNDINTNVCHAKAIFFSPNPCKCEISSAESPLPLDPVKAVVSSSTCSAKTELASPKTPKMKPFFKSNTAVISNADVISEQPRQYSPTNTNLAISSIPIHDVTMSPKSNNLFNGKLTDSTLLTPKFKTYLPQYCSTYQPSLSSKTIEKGIPIKKTLTTPNIFRNILSSLPLSNSQSMPIFDSISTIPSIVTPSAISLPSASNIALLSSSILNTAAPIVYNPHTKPILLPSDSLTAPTITSNSLLNPSSLSSPIFSPSLLNPNNAYSYTNPVVASTLVNTNPTLFSSYSSPTISPVSFCPGPASALVNSNREYRHPWSASVSFYPQIAPASASTLESTTIPIGKTPASLTLSTETNPCISPITVDSSVYPWTKPVQPQVLVPEPISTNTDQKTIPFSAPLNIEPLSTQSSVYPCSMPVPVSDYFSTNIVSASCKPSPVNTSPYIVPSSEKAYPSTCTIPVKYPCTSAVSNSVNSNLLSLICYTEPLKTSNSVAKPVSITKPSTKAVSNAYSSTIPIDTYPGTTTIYPTVTPVTLNDCTNTKVVPTSAYLSVTPVASNYYKDTKPVPTLPNSLHLAKPVSVNTHSDIMAIPTNICESVTQVHDTNYPSKTQILAKVFPSSRSVPINSTSYTTPIYPCTDVVPNTAYLNAMSLVRYPRPTRIPESAFPTVPVTKLVPLNVYSGSKTVSTSNYPCTIWASLNTYSDTKKVPIIEDPSMAPASATNATKTPISASVTTLPVNTYPYTKMVPTRLVPKVTLIRDTDNSFTNLVSASTYPSVSPVAVNTFSNPKTVSTSGVDPNVTTLVRGIDDPFETPIFTNVYSNNKYVQVNIHQNTQTVPAYVYPSVTPIAVNAKTYRNTKTVPATIVPSAKPVYATENIITTPISADIYNSATSFSANTDRNTKTEINSVTPIRVTSYPFTSSIPPHIYPSTNKTPLNTTQTSAGTFPCTNFAPSSIYPYTKSILNYGYPYLNPFSDSFYASEVPVISSNVTQFLPWNTKSKVLPFETNLTPRNLLQATFPPLKSFKSYVPLNAAIQSVSSPISDVSQLSSNTSPCISFSSKEIPKPKNLLTYNPPLSLSNPLKHQPLLTMAPTTANTTKTQPNVVTSIFETFSAANIKPLGLIYKPQTAFTVSNPFHSFAPSSKPIAINSNTPKTYSSLNPISLTNTSLNKPCNVMKAINSNSAPNYTNIKYLTPSPFIQPALSLSNKDTTYFETISMSPKYLSCSSFKNIPLPTNSKPNIMTSLNPYNIVKNIPTSFNISPSTKSVELSRNFAAEPIIPGVTPLNKINAMSCLIPSMRPCSLKTHNFIPKVTYALPTSSYLPKYTAHAEPSLKTFKTTDPLPVSPISCSTPVEKPITNSCRLNQNKPCDYIPIPTYIGSIPLSSAQNLSPTSSPDTLNNVLSSPALTTLLRAPNLDKFTLKSFSGLTPSSTNTISSSIPHYDSGKIINIYETSSIPFSSYTRPIYTYIPSVDQRQLLLSSNPSINAVCVSVRPNELVYSPLKYYNQLKTSTSHGTPSPISSHTHQSVSHFNSPLKATPFGTQTTYSCTPSSFDNIAPSYYKMPTFSTINSSSRPVSSLSSPLSLKLPLYQSTYTQTSNVRPTEPPIATFFSNISPVSQTTIPTLKNIASLDLNAMPSTLSPMPILKSKASLPASQILTSIPYSPAYEYDRLPLALPLPPLKYISPVPNVVNIAPHAKYSNNLPNINVFPKVSSPTNIQVTYPQNNNNNFPIHYSYDSSKPNAKPLDPYTPSSNFTKTLPTPCLPPNNKVFFGSPQNTCLKNSSPVPITSATMQEVTSTATTFATSPLYYPETMSIAKNVNYFENVQNPYIDQSNKCFHPSLSIGSDKTNSYNGLPYTTDSTNAALKNIYNTLQNECLNCQHLSNLLKTNINKIVTTEMLKNFDLQNLTIPVKNIGIVKYVPDNEKIFRVKTSIPGIELKAWPSRITVLKPKIVLEATKYNVVNFLPVVRHNNFDLDIVQNIAKDVVEKNYGKPIVLKGIYDDANSFAVVDDIARVSGGQCLILWPPYCDYNKL